MIQNEKIVEECKFVQETIAGIIGGKRVFERSVSISPTVMPCTDSQCMWVSIADTGLNIFMNRNHIILGYGAVDDDQLTTAGGITDSHVCINHRCIETEEDLFQYRMIFPASTLNIEAIRAIRELGTYMNTVMHIPEVVSNSKDVSSIFSTEFSLF